MYARHQLQQTSKNPNLKLKIPISICAPISFVSIIFGINQLVSESKRIKVLVVIPFEWFKISATNFFLHADPWKPKDNQKEDNYKRFTSLRVQHPNLKVTQFRSHFKNLVEWCIFNWISCAWCVHFLQVSLAIKYSAAEYARNAATQERRQRFIKRATEFIAGHKFNGLDLIWDFSDQRYITCYSNDFF